MTGIVETAEQTMRQRAADQFAQRIAVCPNLAGLNALEELVNGARGGGRISREQHTDLRARIVRRRAALHAATVRYASAPDSPFDCPRCGSPMKRECGPWDTPDTTGRLIVDEQDVCQGCGAAFPVTGEQWSPDEIRARVRAVVAHRRNHSDQCPPDAPCRTVRPGLDYQQRQVAL